MKNQYFDFRALWKIEKSIKKKKLDTVTWGNLSSNYINLVFLISVDPVMSYASHRESTFFWDVCEDSLSSAHFLIFFNETFTKYSLNII